MHQELSRAVPELRSRARRSFDRITACCGGVAVVALLCLAMAACGSGDASPAGVTGGGSTSSPPSTPATPGTPSNPSVPSAPQTPTGPLRTETLTSGLSAPWGLAFLPDGRMLVTQKAGNMVIVSADGRTVSAPISNVPAVATDGQGGLLDVVVDPNFASNNRVYWTFSEAGTGGAGTAVARGRLVGNALQDVAVIFRQLPKVSTNIHFGSRLRFAPDGNLFVTLGERDQTLLAQDAATHLGKVVRIRPDGTVPTGNPNLGTGSAPEVWSLGHRNPQGAAIHPTTGELWVSEHGPQGGDEINIARAGRNYGWPVRSYGCPYGAPVGDACRIGGGTHAPQYIEPLSTWTPTSVAPAGMTFYDGAQIPEWRGSLLMGALQGRALWRLTYDGDRESSRERLFTDLYERIRDVRQGPDGWVYLLTDSGKIIRISR
jgi:glucose/arabinose dehydrogenase